MDKAYKPRVGEPIISYGRLRIRGGAARREIQKSTSLPSRSYLRMREAGVPAYYTLSERVSAYKPRAGEVRIARAAELRMQRGPAYAAIFTSTSADARVALVIKSQVMKGVVQLDERAES